MTNVSELTPRERDVVRLIGREKFSGTETADRLGVSTPRVYAILQSLKHKLPGDGKPMQIVLRYVDRLDEGQLSEL